MNRLIWIFIAWSIGVSVYGQSDYSATAGLSANSSPISYASEGLNRREIRKFPAMYTGYAIELLQSFTPMSKSYPLFNQFGQVQEENRSADGYSYLIAAKFESPDSAKKYLKEMILHRAAKAKLFLYKEGNRSELK